MGQKTEVTMFEGSNLLLTSLKFLNQFTWFFTNFNAILFWTPLLISNWSNL